MSSPTITRMFGLPSVAAQAAWAQSSTAAKVEHRVRIEGSPVGSGQYWISWSVGLLAFRPPGLFAGRLFLGRRGGRVFRSQHAELFQMALPILGKGPDLVGKLR